MRTLAIIAAIAAASTLLSLLVCALYAAIGTIEMSLEKVVMGAVACAAPMLCVVFRL